MDKRLILAVAGSGKTTYILKQLCLEQRHLLVTFTNNNYENLRHGVIIKFGYLPDNIKIYTYFSFLYNFLYKPLLSQRVKAKGIDWRNPIDKYSKKTDSKHYLNNKRYLYGGRISKLLIECGLSDDMNRRIEKYFDCIYFDEVQDFAGNDFNLLKNIINANLKILLVGDFYQHTFDTSRDGAVNHSLHNNYDGYIRNYHKTGIAIDSATLNKSHRCSADICNLVKDRLDIHIESSRHEQGEIIFINSKEDVAIVFQDDSIVKLFYQEHTKYPCYSENWGASKGNDHYSSVCVVVNSKIMKLLSEGNSDKNNISPTTLNKLYVAITRAKNTLLILDQKLISHLKIRN